jgi:hypothetical protein
MLSMLSIQKPVGYSSGAMVKGKIEVNVENL